MCKLRFQCINRLISTLHRIIKGKRKSALRKAQCGVCKLEFDNKELLSVHMASHEDEERLDEADITDQEGMSHCPDPMCEQCKSSQYTVVTMFSALGQCLGSE